MSADADPAAIAPAAFATLASYNAAANRALAALLQQHVALVARPDTTYYGSLLDLLSHITMSDLTWLRRTDAIARLAAPAAGSVTDLDLGGASLSERPFSGLESWLLHREVLDREIELYAGSLTGPGLSRAIEYRNTRGTAFRQPLWQILLHMFNHQTHHRGQIAQVLDENGIENDVSNLIWYLREQAPPSDS